MLFDITHTWPKSPALNPFTSFLTFFLLQFKIQEVEKEEKPGRKIG